MNQENKNSSPTRGQNLPAEIDRGRAAETAQRIQTGNAFAPKSAPFVRPGKRG